MAAEEFIRQFLQHALPRGFQRIRYFGLMTNRHRAEKLALCRQILAFSLADLLPEVSNALAERPDFRRCPRCGEGILARVEIWAPSQGPVPLRSDSS